MLVRPKFTAKADGSVRISSDRRSVSEKTNSPQARMKVYMPTVTIPGKVTAVGKPRFNPRGCGSRIYPGVCSRGNPENGSGAKDGKGKVSW